MAPVPTEVKYEEKGNIPADGTENLVNASTPGNRKKCVVVGLGMVGIAFVEKLLKFDLDGGRDEWEVVVIGEEPHLAYNRVGLSTYWEKKDPASLYLNPLEWYKSHAPGKLTYHTSDMVNEGESDSIS